MVVVRYVLSYKAICHGNWVLRRVERSTLFTWSSYGRETRWKREGGENGRHYVRKKRKERVKRNGIL